MNELHLFSGAGGGILGGKLLGHTCVCAVEISDYRRKVLLQRQRDGYLPRFPIWDDVTTFDGKPWRGRVDVVAGGFPCQDISCAGKGAGIAGAKSGLWNDMARVVREVEPRFVFVENSPMLVSRGLGQVLGDLAEAGFDAEWGVFSAGELGAPHMRERLFILAHSKRHQRGVESCCGTPRRVGRVSKHIPWNEPRECALSRLRGVDDGLARVVDRTDAIRDGQVPAVVVLAWQTLLSRFSSCDSKDQ